MSRTSTRRPAPADMHDPWLAPFRSCIEATLRDHMRILDVGGGRRPVLDPHERPAGSHYTGLDISERELASACEDSYDERVVADITAHRAEMDGSFDLIVSWQVLEHVKPLEAAFANMHSYLRPGGQIVLFLSGAFSSFAVANRLLPNRIGTRIVAGIMTREPDTVFPAFYDQCYPRGLRRILATWSTWEITPAWGGADYLRLFPALQRAYLRYELWAQRGGHSSLATHYLVTARK